MGMISAWRRELVAALVVVVVPVGVLVGLARSEPGPAHFSPSIAEVAAIRIDLGGPMRYDVPMPLDPADGADRATIATILRWLGDAKVVDGNSGPEATLGAYVVIVALSDGSWLSVTDAEDCGDLAGDATACESEFLVGSDDPSAARVRIRSAALARWVENWHEHLKVATVGEAETAWEALTER